MENENFISWGYEDNERLHRLTTLGLRYIKLVGTCYHLNHYRSINSSPNNPFINNNKNEYFRICKMNKDQLINEVASWSWVKK